MRALRFLLLLALAAALGAAWLLLPYGPATETFVDIPTGTGTLGVAHLLRSRGIVRDPYSFALLRVLLRGKLRAGEYRFDHADTAVSVYRRLRRGDVYTHTLVIPEGYNIFDVARAVEAAGLGSASEFLAAERTHTELVRRWSPHARSVEGFLAPETYRFSRHATPVAMLGAMVRQWQRTAEPLLLASLEAASLAAESHDRAAVARGTGAGSAAQGSADWTAAMTMASLIEKEVREPGERPLVAGVFENRLRRGMPLQTDPAVIYAALLEGRYRGTIYASDLRSDSPYNTYRHAGLPPGPVCNPGVASLRAALHPTATEYLYFVSDAAGHTRFARDLKEQTANVASYRRTAGR